jgi:solute carrier family 25 phosphate transporter 3
MLGAFSTLVRTEGVSALFKGLSAICLRQLPYTAVKLVSYELFSGFILASVLHAGFERESARVERMRPAIALGAGMLAGAAAALASQPADVLLTRICGSVATSSLSGCLVAQGWREQLRYLFDLGVRECYRGLGARLVMVASMTSVQFLLYDQVRLRLGCDGGVPR